MKLPTRFVPSGRTGVTIGALVVAAGLVVGAGMSNHAQEPQATPRDAAVEQLVADRAERAAQAASRSVRIGWCGGPADECPPKGQSTVLALKAREAAAAAAAKEAARKKAEAAAKAAKAKKEAAQKAAKAKKRPTTAAPKSGGSIGPVPKSCDGLSGNRRTGCTLMVKAGFSMGQWPCLNKLWNKESGWNHKARNPSSGAYGIPQALPGNKMAKTGSDWRTNPVTQIRWGLGYIKGRYGSPCSAWEHSRRTGWY